MAEQIVYEIDERPAVQATERANQAVDRYEKRTTSAMSVADQAIAVHTKMLDRMGNGLDSLMKNALRAAEAIGGLVLIKRGVVELGEAFTSLAATVLLAAKASAAHSAASEVLLNSYRILRIALSPTLFTGGTIAIGLAAEATLRLASARAKLIDQQALFAAANNSRFSNIAGLDQASAILGTGADFRNLFVDKTGSNTLAQVAALKEQFEDLEDPVERAQKAVELFGEKAPIALKLLDRDLKGAAERAYELSSAFDYQTRVSLRELTEGLKAPGRALDKIADSWRDLIETAKTKIVLSAVFVYDVIKKTDPSQLGGGFGGSLADVKTREPLPSDLEFFTGANKAARELTEQRNKGALLPPGGISGEISQAARDRITVFQRSREGVQQQLSKAKERLQNLFTLLPFGDGVGGELVLPFSNEVARLEKLDQGFDISRARSEAFRTAREARLTAESEAFGPVGKIPFQIEREAFKLSTRTDKEGNLQNIGLTPDTRLELEKTLQAEVLRLQKQVTADISKTYRDQYQERLSFETTLYQKKLDNDERVFSKDLDHLKGLQEFEIDRAGIERSSQLRATEAAGVFGAQTVATKIALEQRKAAIEIQYLEKVEAVKIRLFELDTEREITEEISRSRRAGQSIEETARRVTEVSIQRDEILKRQGELTGAAIQAAQENAGIRSAEIVKGHTMTVFENLKHSAEGVFDALLTKSESIFDAIGNVIKTSILTAMKEVLSSQIAARLTQLFTGQSVSFAGAGTGPLGRFGGILGALGLGGAPVFGGTGSLGGAVSGGGTPIGGAAGIADVARIVGGPGGTSGFAGPVGSLAGPIAGRSSSVSSAAGAAGLGSLFFNSGSISLGAGSATTAAGIGGLGGTLAGLATSPAAAAAGGLLAFAGLQKGGITGLGMSVGGGALAGAALGTLVFPGIGTAVGALIGAGIGAIAGTIRLFVKGATEKTREKIKQAYSIDVERPEILSQIVQLIKQNYGGNIDYGIRTPEIRDMILLYGMQSGQKGTGFPATLQPTTLFQTGGSIFQAPTFSNGSIVSPGSKIALAPVSQAAPELSTQLAKTSDSVTQQIRGVTSNLVDIASHATFAPAVRAAAELSSDVTKTSDAVARQIRTANTSLLAVASQAIAAEASTPRAVPLPKQPIIEQPAVPHFDAPVPELSSELLSANDNIARQIRTVSADLASIPLSAFAPASKAASELTSQIVAADDTLARHIRTASAGFAEIVSVPRPELHIVAPAQQSPEVSYHAPVMETAALELSSRLTKTDDSVARQVRAVSSELADIASNAGFSLALKATTELSSQVTATSDAVTRKIRTASAGLAEVVALASVDKAPKVPQAQPERNLPFTGLLQSPDGGPWLGLFNRFTGLLGSRGFQAPKPSLPTFAPPSLASPTPIATPSVLKILHEGARSEPWAAPLKVPEWATDISSQLIKAAPRPEIVPTQAQFNTILREVPRREVPENNPLLAPLQSFLKQPYSLQTPSNEFIAGGLRQPLTDLFRSLELPRAVSQPTLYQRPAELPESFTDLFRSLKVPRRNFDSETIGIQRPVFQPSFTSRPTPITPMAATAPVGPVQPMHITIENAVSLSLDAKSAQEFLDGRVVNAIVNNPRKVVTAHIAGMEGNFGKRKTIGLQLSPGTLTS